MALSAMRYRIYGYAECSWCVKAKDLLDRYGIAYEAIDIPIREARVAWMDERGFQGKGRTFPKVYTPQEDGKESLIGGYTDLEVDIFSTI